MDARSFSCAQSIELDPEIHAPARTAKPQTAMETISTTSAHVLSAICNGAMFSRTAARASRATPHLFNPASSGGSGGERKRSLGERTARLVKQPVEKLH